jgi:D-hydroxyproline dehydrogenase subunit gamma
MRMPDSIEVVVNGTRVEVPAHCTVAVAMMMAGAASRKSATGELRGPLCGMGICFECRARLNGKLHQRTCQVLCSPGLHVRTDD